MNEPHDPLEAELAAFRPHDVTPALRRRVAGRLAHPPSRRSRWLWGTACAGGLAAACLAAVLLGRGGGEGVDTGRVPVAHRSAPPDRVEDALPTLGSYRQALARSPEALYALLDEHSARAPNPDPRSVRIHAFTRPDLEMRAFTGEL